MHQIAVQHAQSFGARGRFEQRLAFVGVETEHGREHKREPQRIFIGRDQAAQFLGRAGLRQRKRLARQFDQSALQRLNLGASVLRQRQGRRAAFQERFGAVELQEGDALHSQNHELEMAFTRAIGLADNGLGSDGVQVRLGGQIEVGIALRKNQNLFRFGRQCGFHCMRR